MNPELQKQIEAAYDFRGHVTVAFTDGTTLEGFIYNRQFESPLLKEPPYIEMFPKGKDERKKFPISAIASVVITGEDAAAGNSFQDYLKKQADKKKA